MQGPSKSRMFVHLKINNEKERETTKKKKQEITEKNEFLVVSLLYIERLQFQEISTPLSIIMRISKNSFQSNFMNVRYRVSSRLEIVRNCTETWKKHKSAIQPFRDAWHSLADLF